MFKNNLSKSDAMRAVLNLARDWRKNNGLGDFEHRDLEQLNSLVLAAEVKQQLSYEQMLFGDNQSWCPL